MAPCNLSKESRSMGVFHAPTAHPPLLLNSVDNMDNTNANNVLVANSGLT